MTPDPAPISPPNWYRFRVTKVLSAYRYKAARAAVLSRLGKAGAPRQSDIPAALDWVREQWRARLYALRAAGWSRLGKPKDFSYAANCPPFGVLTARTSRRCGWSSLCPFCYARERVIAPFRKLEAGLAARPDLAYPSPKYRSCRCHHPGP